MFFALGENNLLARLKVYFKTYAFRNANHTDFLKVMAGMSQSRKRSKRKLTGMLDDFEDLWLRTAGTNTVGVSWSAHKGTLREFRIEQEPDPVSKTLRNHVTDLSIYHLRKGSLLKTRSVPVSFKKSSTRVPALRGVEEPDLVILNEQDRSFFLNRFDEKSLTTIRRHLSEIPSATARMVVWRSLAYQVRQAKLRADRFLSIASEHLVHEEDELVLASALRSLSWAGAYVSDRGYKAFAAERDEFLRKMFLRVSVQGDRRKSPSIVLQWLQAFIRSATTDISLELLSKLLNSRDPKYRGVVMDQPLRWSILVSLARYGNHNIEKLLRSELERDQTDSGLAWSFAVRASMPEAKSKAEWWKHVTENPKGLSVAKIEGAMGRFFPRSQNAGTAKYVARYFDLLTGLDEKKLGSVYVQSFASDFFPLSHSSEALSLQLRDVLASKTLLTFGSKSALEKPAGGL